VTARQPRLALRFVTALAAMAVLASSCAYYNTFYLARKYYDKGTNGEPYPLEPTTGATNQNFNKSIDYSKKVLGVYSKSKWVDDAYLLWARALLGKADPLQTANMLEAFPTRFPDSPIKDDARFYLGVSYRHARKYTRAVAQLDTFLSQSPKHPLVSYAYLERARALASLERWNEAAESASFVIDRYPKSNLVPLARPARAEAYFRGAQYEQARADFQAMGLASRTDEERLSFLLREADCLEAARDYDAELALLRGALSHEQPPVVTESTTPGQPASVQQVPGYDRYGRIALRVGTAHLLAGRLEEALETYSATLAQYPRTSIGAEAQYRLGFAHETAGDDFERAREEYAKVKEQSAASAFVAQANQRLQNLDRLAQYRSTGADSLERKAEAGFLLAELYLFQLDKPERALEEYRKIATEFAGSPYAGKALNAEAWVLSRKLDRPSEADSLFWRVVHEYPATEAQLAARDYLEARGNYVAADLIRLPEPPQPPALDTLALALADSLARAAERDSAARFAAGDSLLGPRPPGVATIPDSAGVLGPRAMGPGRLFDPRVPDGLRMPGGAPGDRIAAMRDSLRRAALGRDTTFAVMRPDTLRMTRADSLRARAFADSVRARAVADSLRRIRE
jgi:TolA-binding protein